MSRHNALERAMAEALGRHLRQLREEKGLTQEELALAAGVNRNAYQLLEKGIANRQDGRPSNPTLATLDVIASALDVRLVELVAVVEGARGSKE